MADIKVSELTEASTVANEDLLMIVQGGANKKVSCSKFIKVGDSVSDSQALDGHPASDFMLTDDTAADSNKLGGFAANEYAKKSDIPSLVDPTWCAWKPWYKNIERAEVTDTVSQALLALNYVVCDGRFLSREIYSELFDIIGLSWTSETDAQANPTKFRIPDLRGRFILGANTTGPNSEGVTVGEIKTENLPTGIYSGSDFDENGQFMFPKEAGMSGGDPTAVQATIDQMVKHDHNIGPNSGAFVVNANNNITSVNKEGSATGYNNITVGTNTISETGKRGRNDPDNCFSLYPIFGNYNSNTNWARGMLAMPPYKTVVYIMKVKP